MPTYRIKLCQVMVQVTQVTVVADNEDDARDVAIEHTSDPAFSSWEDYELKEDPYVTGEELVTDE